MAGFDFDELKREVAFSASDAQSLAELREPLSRMLPNLLERVCDALLKHPDAEATIAKSVTRLAQFRRSVQDWLDELLCGTYDQRYYEQRYEIGRSHLQAGLPQRHVFAAMNRVRLLLTGEIEALGLPDTSKRIAALEKILDIELAIMSDAYREGLVKRTEEVQHAKYEQRLSESEHLATVGQLAASLAHEIKNPLAGISGAIQVLGAGLAADHPHKEIISEALRQIDRLDAAVKDLLVYARPKPPSTTRVDLNELLERALILFRQQPAFRAVQVRCEGLNGEHEVDVDEAQMQQVISNLLINAAHACEQEGEVLCRISRLESCVRIVIEDDGVGMPPDVAARVFEPFFTTKSRGTGLGLPICLRIVEAHSGTIDIASEPRAGTRVTVEIPSQP